MKNKLAKSLLNHSLSLKSIEDIDDLEFHPQKQTDHEAFNPEYTIIICDNERLFICVHLAMDEKGIYYSGNEIYCGDDGIHCYPSGHRPYEAGASSAKQALRHKLEDFVEKYEFHYDHPLRKIACASKRALRQIHPTIYQMTIFDML